MELADKVEATLKPLYENIWYYQFPRNQKATASMIEYWNVNNSMHVNNSIEFNLLLRIS